MRAALRMVLLLFFVVAIAGCNGGGSGGGGGSLSGVDISPSDQGAGSGDAIEVAQVIHNPEPATMLLWGAGLLGAALARRKANKNK